MAFDLEIVIQGMCTLVPEPDGSKLWVLMRDKARRNGDQIPPHAAFIRFPLDSLVPGTPGFGLRRLENLDVRISGQRQGGMQFKDFNVKTSQPLNGNPAPDSFAWVSPLEEACTHRNLKGGGVVDRRFLKPQSKLTVSDANLMAARFLFTEGTVATNELTSSDGKIIESVFRPLLATAARADDLRQPTAATVLYKTTINAPSVTFECTTLRRGAAAPPLTLRPTGPENKLKLRILNEEAESLVDLQGEPITLGQTRLQDRIFLSMFDFCANPPKVDERPMPVPDRASARFSSIPPDKILMGAPPCSPARGVLSPAQ